MPCWILAVGDAEVRASCIFGNLSFVVRPDGYIHTTFGNMSCVVRAGGNMHTTFAALEVVGWGLSAVCCADTCGSCCFSTAEPGSAHWWLNAHHICLVLCNWAQALFITGSRSDNCTLRLGNVWLNGCVRTARDGDGGVHLSPQHCGPCTRTAHMLSSHD